MQDILDFLKTARPDLDPGLIKIDKLFGQASARQYFRAHYPDDSTQVVMKIPGGFSSPAEEVTKVHPDAPQELPFLNVARYLQTLDLPVPRVFRFDANSGLVLLEDLGDASFESQILKAGPGFREVYYRQAIDLLIAVQDKTAKNQDSNCIAYYRKFDADLLNWEFDHFLEYAIEDRLKVSVSEADKKIFHDGTRALTADIVTMPQGFVHRDFQSRNLMFCNFNFYLIDFQDALIGPVLYDLVALLRDSYIDLSPEEVDRLISYYAHRLPETHPYFSQKQNIRPDFYKIVLQRKLKDTGRFQYIDTVRKNPNFLVHIPLTLTFLKHAFAQVPMANNLGRMLSGYIREWA